MIYFEASTDADLNQIAEWQTQDPSKAEGLSPEYWLTGSDGCIFAARVDDSCGPVLYLRAEQEGESVRFHTLFGTPDVVSQKRIVLTLLEGFPRFKELMEAYGDGLVMLTRSELLARFMVDKFGFVRREGSNDYVCQMAEERGCARE
jgi:hypothetical protein